jgi:hypothetical protein
MLLTGDGAEIRLQLPSRGKGFIEARLGSREEKNSKQESRKEW